MANLWTLAQVFHRSAREHPGHTMVVAGGNKQSYAQVDARSSALAAAMSELGLGGGDRLCIILPNLTELSRAETNRVTRRSMPDRPRSQRRCRNWGLGLVIASRSFSPIGRNGSWRCS